MGEIIPAECRFQAGRRLAGRLSNDGRKEAVLPVLGIKPDAQLKIVEVDEIV